MAEPADKGPLIGYGRTADIFTWGDDQILKLLHGSWPAAAVEEEARIARLVRARYCPFPFHDSFVLSPYQSQAVY